MPRCESAYGVMLQNVSERVRQCYRHAEEARRRAEACDSPAMRADYLDLERRWLHLAQSHELCDRITDFQAAMEHKNRGPA
jgi:hypothetical protein